MSASLWTPSFGEFEQGLEGVAEFPLGSSLPETGERRLQQAALVDAFMCLNGAEGRGGMSFRETYRWFMSDDRSHAFAFLTICETNSYHNIEQIRRIATSMYNGRKLEIGHREVRHTLVRARAVSS